MGDPNTLVTAVEIERQLTTVSRHLVYVWRSQGKLTERGKRGRSPLYRWGDVVQAEAATRTADPAGQRAAPVDDVIEHTPHPGCPCEPYAEWTGRRWRAVHKRVARQATEPPAPAPMP